MLEYGKWQEWVVDVQVRHAKGVKAMVKVMEADSSISEGTWWTLRTGMLALSDALEELSGMVDRYTEVGLS